MRVLLCLALSLICLGLSPADGKADQVLTLGSGTKIAVISVNPLLFTGGQSALKLEYRTSIPLHDMPALFNQVDEVWERFVPDVDRDKYRFAVIGATGSQSGVASAGYHFFFEKRDDSWRVVEPKDTALTPDFIRSFVARIDFAYDHNEMNALLLYMADDWSSLTTYPPGSSHDPDSSDRMDFVTSTKKGLAAMKNRTHTREIRNIAIAANGATAIVESREKEGGDVGGRHFAFVERTTDHFRLQDRTMLWTKSDCFMEQQTETQGD